jgi:Gas vesicle synthesis protein GvpL/GvpF
MSDWVYGVVDAAATVAPRVAGVDPGHAVELVRHGELAALTGIVGFGEASLREALEDLGRLEHIARAHERVLDAALRRGPVVPFRLATLYETRERVREMLAAEQAPLVAALRRLRGKAEWGVKAYAPAQEPPTQSPASGTDYLARKSERRHAAQAVDAAVDAVHERLRAEAVGAVLNPARDRGLLLNAAYLVADADVPAFRALVTELSRRHRLPLQLTGPWPAFHFSR